MTNDWNEDPWDVVDVVPAHSLEEQGITRGPSRPLVLIVVSIFLALVLIAGGGSLWYLRQVNPVGDPASAVNFTVTANDTLSNVSSRLEKEKIITVEKPVEIEKETIRIVEKEVPGPERVVTKANPADAGLRRENKQLKSRIEELELQKEKIVTVEKEATGDLKEAARLLAASEMNKEDLSEGQIFKLLQKSRSSEVYTYVRFVLYRNLFRC